MKIAEFLLKNNYLELNGSIKQQFFGTAIRTKFAPPYACNFMDKLETNFLKTQTLQHLVWFRYIFLWTLGEENLILFLDNVDNYDPNIKFTHEYSKKEMPFLDLKVGIKNRNVTTDSYVKDTDRNYLHYASAHPYHTKKCIVFSQALCLSRLCTFEKDFESYIGGMKQWFAKKDYPQDLINSVMNKVKFPYVQNKYNNN